MAHHFGAFDVREDRDFFEIIFSYQGGNSVRVTIPRIGLYETDPRRRLVRDNLDILAQDIGRVLSNRLR